MIMHEPIDAGSKRFRSPLSEDAPRSFGKPGHCRIMHTPYKNFSLYALKLMRFPWLGSVNSAVAGVFSSRDASERNC